MINLVYNKQDLRFLFVLHDNEKMMIKKRVRRGNHFAFIDSETTEINALEEHLNKIPEYQYLPSFSGIPRPVAFLEKTRIKDKIVHYCNSGLWKEITDWCKKNGVKVNKLDNHFKLTGFELTLEEFQQYVSNWGLNLDPRDYQIEAAWKILHYRQSLSQLATRAGKTLIAYIIFRYMLENGAHNILMVVPSISLVKQGLKDMSEYKEFFQGEAVWANGEYVESSNLTIGTFQSLILRCSKKIRGRSNKHYNPKFFEKFDVVCIDECHKAECESIKEILKQPFMKDVKIKFGFSGTLPDENTIESYGVQALLGPCIQDISSYELIESGFLAKPIINQIRLHYDDNDNITKMYNRYGEYLCSYFDEDENGSKIKLPKDQQDMTMIYQKSLPVAVKAAKNTKSPEEYREFLIDLCKASGANLLNMEQMIAEHSSAKLQEIYDIVFSWAKNGIIFAHNEAYIDFLYDSLKNRFPERNVYKIKGSTSVKKRDKIKQAMNEIDTDAILVASYGCVGTGLTFKNIDYCILSQSFKSKIINLQSIGRGLLLKDDKSKFYVYDIIDCLPTGRLEKHGKEKCKTYDKSKYEYKITTKHVII